MCFLIPLILYLNLWPGTISYGLEVLSIFTDHLDFLLLLIILSSTSNILAVTKRKNILIAEHIYLEHSGLYYIFRSIISFDSNQDSSRYDGNITLFSK